MIELIANMKKILEAGAITEELKGKDQWEWNIYLAFKK
jgi:hypothetical protein